MFGTDNSSGTTAINVDVPITGQFESVFSFGYNPIDSAGERQAVNGPPASFADVFLIGWVKGCCHS